MYKFDALKVKNQCVEWIRNFFEENGKGCNAVVGISGGKDSMILAKCMQELQRHGKFHFDIEYLCMNPGYNEINKQKTIDNCKLRDLPI